MEGTGGKIVIDITPLRELISEEIKSVRPQEVVLKNNVCSEVQEGVPIWEKVTLTIEEAAMYSGIGIKKLYELAKDPRNKFVLFVGNRRLIKRKEFDKFIESHVEI